jgi:protein gp37
VSASRIEWTGVTWNPVTGCTKVSEGCRNCYAERMARRLRAMGQPNYADGFAVRTHEHILELPATWKKPRTVFVNSMGDLFHEQVPFDFVQRVFGTMANASQHQFQLLTKRSARLAELSALLDWPDKVWMGVSVESRDWARRVDDLRHVGAAIRFLSLEPLLGPLPALDLAGIDWVIVGGESGPGARPLAADWVRGVRDQCVDGGIPFFFKQWGGTRKREAGRVLDGEVWAQMPVIDRRTEEGGEVGLCSPGAQASSAFARRQPAPVIQH